MRPFYILLPLLAFCAAWIPFRFDRDQKFSHEARQSVALKKEKTIRCSPDWSSLRDWLEEGSIPPIPGAGNYTWKISTLNDSAQFYFNQGINMYYGFHIIEAMASFKKATLFDPTCAMLYWAQALSYGPNINDYGYRASPDALAVMAKASELKSTATPFERDLINAMQVRYTADSADATRATLNQAYTDKMKQLSFLHRQNADAMTLYADAMMLQHPWDLWTPNGKPKPWTPAIRQLLEEILTKHPSHPGANHYYIHVMEPSPFAEKALASADRLGTTNPGLSHMVHMPSHIYLRTGNYSKGVQVNTNAVESYQRSLPLYPAVAGADFLYLIHNLHMLANNAMMEGNYEMATKSAIDTRESVPNDYLALAPPFGSLLQYIHMTPVLVNIRFGKWTELLNEPAPESRFVYSSLLYHFGRGMALAKTGELASAKNELNLMEELMKDSKLQIAMVPFSPPIDGAIVASNLLSGTIAMQEKNLSVAIERFSHAVDTEKKMVYNEPRDWLLNPRHFLGNAYLVHNDFSNAEKTFRDDLAQNNDNVWALIGLYQSLKGGGKHAEANKVSIRYKKALTKADVSISASVY